MTTKIFYLYSEQLIQPVLTVIENETKQNDLHVNFWDNPYDKERGLKIELGDLVDVTM